MHHILFIQSSAKRTSKLLPCLGYCKQCCGEHWGACVLFETLFYAWPIPSQHLDLLHVPSQRNPSSAYRIERLSSTACLSFLRAPTTACHVTLLKTSWGVITDFKSGYEQKCGFKLGSSKPEVVRSIPMMEDLYREGAEAEKGNDWL